ncbi:hypothetical protein ABEW03_06690 [Virgibacillus pantothenticus]|uniref:hypothetical protein n=1 Tax=Virgibacillus pantothenticus TaxID=1473 RepID=UPI0020C082BC|nr:hypothetical protein [Virgibacillus pantothenticus]
MIPELILHSTGVDIIEQQILNCINQDITIHYPKILIAGIHFFTSNIEGNPYSVDYYNSLSGNPLVKSIEMYNYKTSNKPKNAYDRLGYVITADQDRNAIIRFLDNMKKNKITINEEAGH